MLVFALAVALGFGSKLFTNLIGIAYPTLRSIQALESPQEDDDKQWLTYWCIFGIFSVMDEFSCCILHYIPFYFFIKVCIFIWLFNPATQGATLIYEKIVVPGMNRYKD